MCAESMRAILAGRKSLTTRVVTPQPEYDGYSWRWEASTFRFFNVAGDAPGHEGHHYYGRTVLEQVADALVDFSPYHVGERVALSEGFYVLDWSIPLSELQPLHYAADVPDRRQVEDYRHVAARFMPVWASRQIVVITSMAAGRLHDMTIDDLIAEGWDAQTSQPWLGGTAGEDARAWYMALWDRLNAKRGYPWDMNPWVWRFGFEKEVQ
jgi:hypothetical protein